MGATPSGTGLYAIDTVHGGAVIDFTTAPAAKLLAVTVDPTATDGTAFTVMQATTATYQLAKISLTTGVVTNVGPVMTIHPRGQGQRVTTII